MIKENKTYELFIEIIYNEEIGTYKAYGIKNKSGTIVINDVTCNYEDGMKLLDLLNKYKVSSCHLRDVIIDFINDI